LDEWTASYGPYDAVDPSRLVFGEYTEEAAIDPTAAVSETGATYNDL
jgi:hypothetical protein